MSQHGTTLVLVCAEVHGALFRIHTGGGVGIGICVLGMSHETKGH